MEDGREVGYTRIGPALNSDFQEAIHMDRQDYILLFNCLHPDFFAKENFRDMPEEFIFDEMILSLKEFDINKYDKNLDNNISFGFYDGNLDELKKVVEKVNQHWVPFYDGKQRIYAAM